MRLKIQLKMANAPALPFNYNYQFSAAIYNLLRFGSPDFAGFLHSKGYELDGKSYKLFSFALKFDHSKNERKHYIINSGRIDLIITTPIIDEFLRNFISGSFHAGEISPNTFKLSTVCDN